MVKQARNRLAAAIAAGVGLTSALATPAMAQDAQSDAEEALFLEEVIVTGTRIVTADGFGRTSPVTVVGMEEIEEFGFTRVEDFLNQLPSIEAAQNSFLSNNSTGTASLDLRGLGTDRTLVLINGRRMQPGGVYSIAPDVNQIPAAMIERVEVLTGGASATYGADAVAGVVNFIMRRVDGVELSTGLTGYQHDNDNAYMRGLMDAAGYDYPTGSTGLDGKSYFANLVIGGEFANGRGNATAYVNWRENDALLQGARDYSSCSLRFRRDGCGGSATADVPNFVIAPLTEDGVGPYGMDFTRLAPLTLQPDSSLQFYDGSNIYNFAPINFFMRPDERWSMGAFLDFEINPHAVGYLEIMFASDRTTVQVAESGTFFVEPYPLPLDNAYFPETFRESLRAIFPGEDEFGIYIGKRNTEGGPRRDAFRHESLRAVAGVKGELFGDWTYDVSYLHAQTNSSSSFENDLYKPNVAIAVDSRLCEADRDCIPYEVFTYQGVIAEAAASLSETALTGADTATDIFQAYATGDVGWGLSAGDILAVAGYEYRRVEFERRSDATFQQGQLVGRAFAVPDIVGVYSVDELFFEANIPLLADTAFARNLTMDLAYRWSDYTSSGQSSTYRAGIDWQTLEWLRLRTGYNHAVRTPNVGELNLPRQLGSVGFEDPCLGPEPLYSLEQCTRTGMSAAQYGNTFVPDLVNWVNTLEGGNPALEPEEADTFTAGLVFDIGDNMRLAIDYWDIQIEGVISTIPPAQTFDQCALFGRLCELVQRNAAGNMWLGDKGYIIYYLLNLGEQHSSGVDVAWDWELDANWRFDLIGSYYLKREVTAIPGEASSISDCVGIASQICFPNPKWRHVASATYDSGRAWSVSARWRSYDSVDYEEGIDPRAEDELTAFNYIDLNATYRFMDAHRLTAGVNNIFDEEPPLLAGGLGTNANTYAGFYDTLGRFVFVNFTLGW